MINTVYSLKVMEIYTSDKIPMNIVKQSIVTNKKTYIQGETAIIEDYQSIDADCDSLQAKFTLFNPSGSIKESETRNLGQGSYMTTFYRLSQDTSNLLGEYKIESRWFCDGEELGQDGKINNLTERT